ncbi:MAG: ABC transporter ATP-binding protein [Crenarchaeota archaeon]|nr:ABC transporter ATP-binding protein [Thermoproteota archaeon]MCR8471591.1 ABC transporter ATP-binding protein [Thermoproteota archaeon]MCR8473055.1 ABC transporter ATP-binding protein [Thermoproteota archaeon]MCR8488384.1 ABC transporter ATP-binding protein [Thermoproteota archaeon]
MGGSNTTSSESLVVEARDLWKTYVSKERVGLFKSKVREVQALKGVSLDVYENEIFGLLGPNGAGKTTLIKILTTLLIPDRGYAKVLGFDIVKQSNDVRKRLGVMLMGERALYWKLTGRENLEFFGALYHIPREILSKRIQEIIDFLGIQDFVDRLVETYSSGQRVLLAFAKALVNDAPLLFLDEPTVALDPARSIEIRRKIKQLKGEGKTIFLTTHIMTEAEELCDRVAIIDSGKIVAIGKPEELKRTLRGLSALEVEMSGNNLEYILSQLKALEGVSRAAITYETTERGIIAKLRVLCDSPRDILPIVVDAALQNDLKIWYIKPTEPTLEDVFLYYTGKPLG